MAQAFGAVVGQQLYRRVTQFAAALIGIGLTSLWYPGSVAAASLAVSVSKQNSATIWVLSAAELLYIRSVSPERCQRGLPAVTNCRLR